MAEEIKVNEKCFIIRVDLVRGSDWSVTDDFPKLDITKYCNVKIKEEYYNKLIVTA